MTWHRVAEPQRHKPQYPILEVPRVLEDGNCAGDPRKGDLLFPNVKIRNAPEWEKGKAVCYGCPVLEPCLEFAILNREQHGVWGGMTPWERRRLVQGIAVHRSGSSEEFVTLRLAMRENTSVT